MVPLAPRSALLAGSLLALTVVATALTGAVLAHAYFGGAGAGLADVWLSARWLALGSAYFGLPLVGILVVHEAGHWLMMRRLGLPAPWPLFLPLPYPLSLSGTLGAIIVAREPAPDRRAMALVGASGPLAGVGAAVVVLVCGLALSLAQPAVLHEGADGAEAGRTIALQTPILYDALAAMLGVPAHATLHPLAFAGFWGLFLTSLQLFPAGQLDGGHVARAILGARARWLAWVTVVALLALGLAPLAGLPGFAGYAVLGIIVLLTGVSHPGPSDDAPARGRVALVAALACVVVFVLTFVPVPISG